MNNAIAQGLERKAGGEFRSSSFFYCSHEHFQLLKKVIEDRCDVAVQSFTGRFEESQRDCWK